MSESLSATEEVVSNRQGLALVIRWSIVSLRRAGWAPIFVFGIQVATVLVFDIYSHFPDFDIPMHYFGGVAIAHFFATCFVTARQMGMLGKPSAAVFPPMILGLTCLAAVVWEFAEHLMDRVFLTISQPGVPDTMLDLLLGLLGGICLIVVRKSDWSGDERS